MTRLAEQAGERIGDLGYNNLDIHVGDGSQGLPDQAAFDRIMVTAAAPRLPNALCAQLQKHGGQMILPIGDEHLQELKLITRRGERFTSRTLLRCRFVPLIGRYGFDSDINNQPRRYSRRGGMSEGANFNLDLIQMVQRARMLHDETAVPSDMTAVYWIEAKRRDGDTPGPTSTGGRVAGQAAGRGG